MSASGMIFEISAAETFATAEFQTSTNPCGAYPNMSARRTVDIGSAHHLLMSSASPSVSPAAMSLVRSFLITLRLSAPVAPTIFLLRFAIYLPH